MKDEGGGMKLGSRRSSVEVVTGRGVRIRVQWQLNTPPDEVTDASKIAGGFVVSLAALRCVRLETREAQHITTWLTCFTADRFLRNRHTRFFADADAPASCHIHTSRHCSANGVDIQDWERTLAYR